MSENELVLRLALLLGGILMVLVMLLRARLLAARPRADALTGDAPAESDDILSGHVRIVRAPARIPEDRGCGIGRLAETHGLE